MGNGGELLREGRGTENFALLGIGGLDLPTTKIPLKLSPSAALQGIDSEMRQ